MASSVHDHSRRHDTRRRRRQTAESDAVSDVDEVEDPQPRGSNHPKKSQKQQTPTHITFEIHGPVTISGDLNLGHENRDDRRRRTPSSTQGSTGRLQPSRKRPTTPCDFQSDDPSESEEDESSYSNDGADSQSRRATKTKIPHERHRGPAGRRTKRYQADEGYHTGSTGSYTTESSTQSAKVRGKVLPSKASESSARQARLSSSVKPRKAEVIESDSEGNECHSDAATEEDGEDLSSAGEDDEDDEEDASDDDFGKLPVQISSKEDFSKSIDEKAVLDTGTKPDWISASFYDELKSSGIPVERAKLSAEEQKIKYTDFNNKKFSPTSKVELVVQSDEFTGAIKCRNLTFFVASKATFSMLIGRDTIRKQKIMTRGKPDPDGEGVFVGVHGDIPEEEKAAIKKKREEQSKAKEERKRQRDAKLEETLKTKTKAKSSSNQAAAHLATVASRNTRIRSPARGANKAVRYTERQSDSSLEGTW
ncbi:hypothetical protein BKA65DRAFT_236538 [Rhexocercosporidium sp. MPI-PUGE-AT-0058]|nr:hypothetical protein BKA65DRAFT_236538 [Rhexocercosporidium sp. MPI-PUGE-AT-0058]